MSFLNSRLLTLLEITLHGKEYIKRGTVKPCYGLIMGRRKPDVVFKALNHKMQIRIKEGNLGKWFRYMDEEGVEDIKFCANLDDFNYQLTRDADWGIAAKSKKPTNEYIWKYEDINVLEILNNPPLKYSTDIYWKLNVMKSASGKCTFREHKMITDSYCYFQEDMYEDFLQTLISIKEIAHNIKMYHFEEMFQLSLDILEGRKDPEAAEHYYIRLPEFYGEKAQRKLSAISNLYIYGGSGNWDDHPVASSYDETEKLFLYGMSVLANIINYGGE